MYYLIICKCRKHRADGGYRAEDPYEAISKLKPCRWEFSPVRDEDLTNEQCSEVLAAVLRQALSELEHGSEQDSALAEVWLTSQMWERENPWSSLPVDRTAFIRQVDTILTRRAARLYSTTVAEERTG